MKTLAIKACLITLGFVWVGVYISPGSWGLVVLLDALAMFALLTSTASDIWSVVRRVFRCTARSTRRAAVCLDNHVGVEREAVARRSSFFRNGP